ncbi:hypothetical protein B0H19DRAFT_1375865 [Mycena capillaripes]|nr:hypothetical protein B0H19DRAFT_1375865 [Mycena capillaripes]
MDSPFQDILHTNIIPSDFDCQRICNFLPNPEKELENLTEELARLDALRKDILRKRRELRKFIDAHRALLSPVRRLPEDIVRAIFMACLPSTRNPTLSDQDAPLLLCRICRSWRDIALATPRLWAAIHIVVPAQWQLQHLVDRVAAWFERSGVVPLTISMVLSRTCEIDWDISPLLSALVAVSRRWKSIEIPLPENFENPAPMSPLLSVASDDVPLLETVKLSQRNTSMTPANYGPLTFLAADGLRSLTLPASRDYREAPVSWKSLTNLKITPSGGSLTCAAVLAMLQLCTSLQTCEFTMTEMWDEEETVLTEPLSLSQLSHLTIIRPNCIPRQTLFGSVALPNLRPLHYESRGGTYETNLAPLLPSTPTLESFRISAVGLPSQGYLDILSLMPMLRELTILDEPFTPPQPFDPWSQPRDAHFLEHLMPSQGLNPVVCPRLEFIELENFSAASDETLLQFVQSRTRPQIQNVTHLSHIVVAFSRPKEFDILSPLQDAIAAGLVISLNYLPDRTGAQLYSPLEGTSDFDFWGGWGRGWQPGEGW